MPPINNNSTVPGSSSGENFNGFVPKIPSHRPSQSVILAKGSGSNNMMSHDNFGVDFDMQSTNSAFFLKDDELEAYEEKMEQRIQDVWGSIEK